MTRNTYIDKKNTIKYIVGIDEVGRGPLAGPVTVAAFCIPRQLLSQGKKLKGKNIKKMFAGAKDSKKMSATARRLVFSNIKEAHDKNIVRYIVQNQSAKVIDTQGLSVTIRRCIGACLEQLKKELTFRPEEVLVLLDGGLKAPKEFVYQETIIRGDDKEPVISLASICAKVTRDAYMMKMAKKYPQYGFEKHVGYGTTFHREMIRKYGITPIHRISFLRNIIDIS